jgi:hypothetical protein
MRGTTVEATYRNAFGEDSPAPTHVTASGGAVAAGCRDSHYGMILR